MGAEFLTPIAAVVALQVGVQVNVQGNRPGGCVGSSQREAWRHHLEGHGCSIWDLASPLAGSGRSILKIVSRAISGPTLSAIRDLRSLIPTDSPQGNFTDTCWLLGIPLGSSTKETVLEACPDAERKYGAKSLGGGLDGVSTLLMSTLVIP